MTEIYVVIGMALVTFFIRYSMFAVSGQIQLPVYMTQVLRYVPPAVLTAITVPAVLMPHGEQVELTTNNPYLIGALVACAVGWYSRNLLLTIVVGMVAFLGWQWILTMWMG
ncbi:AzlD domain-containing protein [Anaerolineales bacterium HSG6]|nr:AzlD domain-containing protein [Anaerolineales bacterium HSG6]MDM8531292.1 AzlD domain-containing protein [Anaerolineales bacterium HSG25]